MASTTSTGPTIIDDKSAHCIPFILKLGEALEQSPSTPNAPFIIGLNGIQGAGKTTLVNTLSTTLSSPPHNLLTLVISIDDFYLSYEQQRALAAANPTNKLLQHRGEPGTHDVELLADVLAKLKRGEETKIPRYDKSAHNGKGDRVPISEWKTVNSPGSPRIYILIIEGWCVGFRALPDTELEASYAAPSLTLKQHKIEDLLQINTFLRNYDVLTYSLDAFIHLDAQDKEWVYTWREEQEVALRRDTRSGMTEDEVRAFVDGYYPAYELYTAGLYRGLFARKGKDGWGRQLRLVVGRDRKVVEVFEM